jgi:diguanylate cyclase (GGDEF)-like protein
MRRVVDQVGAGLAQRSSLRACAVRALAGGLAAIALVAVAQARPAASAAAEAAATATAVAYGTGWVEMANTVFEHLGPHDGLPHPIVTAIAEDGHGYLWAGTQEGLARWDGYRFRVYPARADDPHSLPASFVRSIGCDATGRLWVGLDGSGVARFDEADNSFVRYGESSVVALSPDAEGGMWAASVTGLLHVRASGVAEKPWAHGGKGPDPLPDASITAVLQDRAGGVWVGSASGLVRRFPDGRTGSRIELPGFPAGVAIPVDSLIEDEHGRIWIGSNLHGVFVYDPATRAVARLHPSGVADPALATDSVMTFAETDNGEMWIGTVTGGIVVADTTTLATRRVMRDRSVSSNLQSNWIWGLHRDRGGQMWVASTAGLSRTRPQQDAILSLFSADGSAWSDPYVLAVDADQQGAVSLGQHGGIEVIDSLQRKMTSITAAKTGDHGARTISYVTSIVHTPDGTRYMGTREGLFVLPPHGKRLELVPLPQRGAVKTVTALMLDGSTLWIGGRGDGIWQMDLGSPGHPLSQPVPTSSLSDPEVTAIAQGPGDSVWIGTENGLNFLRKGQPNERIVPLPGDAASLTAAVVNTLLTDKKGRLWVGSNAGAQILERRDANGVPRFHKINHVDGLTSENVDSLLLDGRGRVWASTDDGLVVIDPDTYKLRALHAADGAAISTYWVNSATAGPHGELFFGGLGGLTVVRPERLAQRNFAAPLVVTDVEVGGKPATLTESGGSKSLTVPADAGGFSLEFSLLDFSAPERNRYAYWLEGYDKTWREVDPTHRSASYTNLSPARYRLHLKAATRDGAWTEHPLTIVVDILPTWYQAWWFDLIKVALAVLAVAAIVAVRVRYVQARSQELESVVEQRTHELTLLQHQLEELAYSDALTSLPNRRMFSDYCKQMIATCERQDTGFALLLIDLDHFKQVNDTLGHDAGDALLVETARRLREIARKADVVARLGGDEFAILLADTAVPSAVDIACKRILDAFDDSVSHDGHEMRASPSIGVALFPVDGVTQDELYKSADLALYEAKRSGRHTWRFAGMRRATEVAGT